MKNMSFHGCLDKEKLQEALGARVLEGIAFLAVTGDPELGIR